MFTVLTRKSYNFHTYLGSPSENQNASTVVRITLGLDPNFVVFGFRNKLFRVMILTHKFCNIPIIFVINIVDYKSNLEKMVRDY